jgi:hypothetical protein
LNIGFQVLDDGLDRLLAARGVGRLAVLGP